MGEFKDRNLYTKEGGKFVRVEKRKPFTEKEANALLDKFEETFNDINETLKGENDD